MTEPNEPPANPPPGGVTADLPVLEGVRPPSLAEKALFDAYSEAVKGSLAAATSAAEKVLTAVFSLATAYVAVIGLLRPEKTPAPLVVAAPVVLLAAAAVCAMVALVWSIGPSNPSTVDEVRTTLASALKVKRIAVSFAVGLLVVAIAAAGIALIDAYGTTSASPANSPTPS